ncbi:MAG TPA: sigma-70 family RNA polymerase sigma factor [Nocardioides sp.]|uniref:sigma-70 family RNA polymerase sigma factor n=1 Tax=Nocardioides sp. TaxID=35761 RepID=UPI002F40CF30
MSVSLSVDGPGDAELISAVRGGDVDAYGELFARHVDAARRLARQLTGPADADDLVSDAFTKVLTVLQRGGGPDLAFRAYLLTAVRRLHVDKIRAGSRLRPVDDLAPFDPGLPFHDTAVEGFDNAAAARAFASLPERWQMVLWHTEVEQQKPADIAPLLGMSANSVSALAYRAREGLRQAFLSQHATDPDDVDCAWTRDHLGAYVRGGLSRRDATKVDDHLAVCRACAAVYLELTEVNSGLAALLAPLLLGSAGAGYLSSSSGAGSGALTGGFAAAKAWAAAHASLTAIGGMVVTATAVFSIYGATQLHGHSTAELGSPPTLSHPAASTLPATGGDRGGRNQGHQGHQSGRSQTPTVGPAVGTAGPTPSASPTSTPTPSAGPSVPADPTSSSSPTDPSSSQPSDPSTGPTVQSVAFTSTPPSNPAFGSTYRLAATGGAGDITFSVDPATTSDACTIKGPRTVLFQHAGTCVVVAQDSGKTAARVGVSSQRAHSRDAKQRIYVPKEPQTVTITSTPQEPVVDGTPYTMEADPGVTGNDITYTASGGCSVDVDTVSFQHATSCTVTAHQDGNGDYNAADDSQTFHVGQGSQTITFTLDSTAAVGDTRPLTAIASSGLPVTLTVDETTSADVCTLSDDESTVSFVGAGSCVIYADQPGNADYQQGARVTQSTEVAVPIVAFMTVNATAEPLKGNGQQQVTVTVDGLPDQQKAQVEVVFPSTAHVDESSDACTVPPSADNSPGANSNQVYDCEVTQAGEQKFTFSVTVNKGRQDVTGTLSPEGDLRLDPNSKTTFKVTLVNDDSTTATRSFTTRTQA